LAIVLAHFRLGEDLREDRAVRRRTEFLFASKGELELLTEEYEEFGPLLGRGEREKLADLKDGDAGRALVFLENVAEGPVELSQCIF